MFEDSVDAFIQRWHPFVVPVRIFPKVEGSPLFECQAGGVILSLLERTGPYESVAGEARVIINATTLIVEQVEPAPGGLEVLAISQIRALGQVVVRNGNSLVVDVGIPIVLGVHDPLPNTIEEGITIRFDSVPPLHGFVVPFAPQRAAPIDEEQLI